MNTTEINAASVATSIRFATLDDADELASFSRQAFQDAFEAQNEPDNVRDYVREAFSLSRTRGDLCDPRAVTLTQWLGSDLCGFARLSDKSRHDRIEACEPLELQRIYVDKQRAIRGLGTQLLNAVIEYAVASANDVLWLGVWEHNEGAQRFYLRHGFAEVGSQTFMLGSEAQRDIVMMLRLSGGAE